MIKKKFLWLFLLLGLSLFFIIRNEIYSLDALYHRCSKITYKFLYDFRDYRDPSFRIKGALPNSRIPLDVVIPVIEKDIPVASHTIDSVRQMVMHPIRNIYLIAPESKAIRALAKHKNCIFILENTVLDNFNQVKKYGGWNLQQFLKLAADKLVEEEHFLVVDADTIFIRPQIFILDKDKTYLINVANDYTPGSRGFIHRALGAKARYPLDFITHHMVFSKTTLQSLKHKLESLHKCSWSEALMKLMDQGLIISEYNLYMSFLTQHTQEKFKFIANANIALFRDRIDSIPNIYASLVEGYKSISLHSFWKMD